MALLDRLNAPVLLRNLQLEHPTTQALLKAAPHIKILNSWERAGLAPVGSFDDWLMQNFDQKRRKEFKRLKARLAEQGQLTVKCLQPDEDLAPYIAGFLPLESAGWKGKRGTAVENDQRLTRALKAGLAAMHGLEKLRFWEMALDGKPIASLFALVDSGEATLGKIAHDETWSKFSPGVLIILEATQSLLAEPGLTLADSNAIPDHPMINRIWRDRISCIDMLVAGPPVSKTKFSTLSLFLGTKHASRALAKRAFMRVTGRKRS